MDICRLVAEGLASGGELDRPYTGRRIHRRGERHRRLYRRRASIIRRICSSRGAAVRRD